MEAKKGSPTKTTLTRREAGKVILAGLGAAAAAFFLPGDVFGRKPVDNDTFFVKKEFDPLTLQPVFDENTGAAFFIDETNQVRRVSAAPAYQQRLADDKFTVSVPWQGKDPRKPDAPWGWYKIQTADGQDTTGDLQYVNGVQIATVTDNNTEQSPANPLSFRAVFDSQTGTTYFVDEADVIQRIESPPEYQQRLADDKFTVSVPWQGKDPRKPDAPWGWYKIQTADGQDTTGDLQYARKLRLVLPIRKNNPPPGAYQTYA